MSLDRRLRVLLISHLYPRVGADTYGIFVREQAEALARHADVTVVVGRFGGRAKSEALSLPGVRVVEVPLPAYSRAPSPVTLMRAVGPYARHVRAVAGTGSERFDIAHAHFAFPDGYVGVRHALREGLPSVVTLHGSDVNRQLARPLVGAAIARTLARADRLLCVNPSMASEIERLARVRPGVVTFLPNGYNSREIRPHTARQPEYFLFLGGLNPGKNPVLLVEAFAQVADTVPYDLVMVGEGPLRDAVVHAIGRLGLHGRVRLEGQLEHRLVDDYFDRAAALVLPSRAEGMPIVVNEALASGTPVVASRLPGTVEQVSDDRFGLLVEPGDVDALAHGLAEAAARRWDYAAIASESGVMDWDAYAQRLVDIYQGILDTRAGVARS